VIDVQRIERQIDTWLDEDIGSGDLTTDLMIEAGANGRYRMVPRGPIVVAGIPVVERIFKRRDPRIAVTQHLRDGEEVGPGGWLVTVEGPVRAILTAERVALNLVQRLSSVATETARFVAAIAGTRAVIVDSRQTTPGLRVLEKYAVTCGGGHNHRMALDGGILLAGSRAGALGGIAAAIAKARPMAPLLTKIGVECDTLEQVEAAVEAGADLVMLDMDNEAMREAVRRVGGRAVVGCYGDVTLANIRGKAETGVDVISVNRLTQSPPMVDIGLDEAVA
jgi:nicotinate-nucleotide pyrophosphorylase (carboxylating)